MKIVCISDTHMFHREMKYKVPDGDVLVHAGDMTHRGWLHELESAAGWLAELPHNHKFVICGNHEYHVSEQTYYVRDMFESFGVQLIHNKTVEVDGLKFYGEPRTPEFFNWGWMYKRGHQAATVWSQMPDDIDVLVCHGPPLGYLDMCPDWADRDSMIHVGCKEQLDRLHQVKPKYVICGHIHESYGFTKYPYGHVINASICNSRYKPHNPPIVIDTDLDLVYKS